MYRHFVYKGAGLVRTRSIVDGGAEFNFDLRWKKDSEEISRVFFTSLKRAYRRKLEVNVKKMDDLKKFKRFLPTRASFFWNKIYQLKTCTKEDSEEYDDQE
ncbi:hypothetical protein U1Q18_051143 [Sarracenia purpurea var. burkii]